MTATPCWIERDGRRFTAAPSITKAIDVADRAAAYDPKSKFSVRRKRDNSLVFEIQYPRKQA